MVFLHARMFRHRGDIRIVRSDACDLGDWLLMWMSGSRNQHTANRDYAKRAENLCSPTHQL